MGLVLLLGGVGTGVWAGRTVLAPSTNVDLRSEDALMVRATSGQIEEHYDLEMTVGWTEGRAPFVGRSGILTSTHLRTDVVTLLAEGDQVMTIDYQPVVVAAGSAPASRSMMLGTTGPDVEQLNGFLQRAGYARSLSGDVFTDRTSAAVVRWHEAMGVDPSDVVEAGALLFVPDLPASLALSTDVGVGAHVDAGIGVLRQLIAPSGSLEISTDQQALIGDIAYVEATIGEVSRHLQLGSATVTPEGLRTVELVGVLCDPGACSFRVDAPTAVPARVVVTPPTSGVILPAAAVRLAADGSLYVVRGDLEVPVTVTASAGGRVIVEGVENGDDVTLP